jgi:hypothetical protein
LAYSRPGLLVLFRIHNLKFIIQFPVAYTPHPIPYCPVACCKSACSLFRRNKLEHFSCLYRADLNLRISPETVAIALRILVLDIFKSTEPFHRLLFPPRRAPMPMATASHAGRVFRAGLHHCSPFPPPTRGKLCSLGRSAILYYDSEKIERWNSIQQFKIKNNVAPSVTLQPVHRLKVLHLSELHRFLGQLLSGVKPDLTSYRLYLNDGY